MVQDIAMIGYPRILLALEYLQLQDHNYYSRINWELILWPVWDQLVKDLEINLVEV